MWTKKINNKRKMILRTQANANTMKEVVVEEDSDREAEVEDVVEDETTDTNSGS